ncbi:MAG: GNAT family protein [Pseudoclavibacter sp.]|nr:GNAT family protein [Pseudoclavibacter sp.]
MSLVPTLRDGAVTLRPVRLRDARELERLLLVDREWLAPWEASSPQADGSARRWDVRGSIRSLLGQASERTALPFAIEYEGRLSGQLTVSGISYGAVCSASLGYWVARVVAGRGVAPTATALASDYCLFELGLHRMEICIRPENAKSLRVVQKLGFRYEGLRRRYIHIDGDWRDHVCFAVVREEVPRGVLQRWRSGQADPRLAAVPEGDLRRGAAAFP